MEHKICKVLIDGEDFEFKVDGDFFWGNDEVLYDSEGILSKVSWEDDGYAVIPAAEENEFNALRSSVEQNVKDAVIASGILVDDDFRLEDYHRYVTSDESHLKVIDVTRDLELKDFDFDIDLLATRFGREINQKLTSYVSELGKSHIQIRISRPQSLDINPPHRDGYLSYWHNILNIWMPIAGCNRKTSLPVVPKSHKFNEKEILRTQSKGAYINGIVYYVPCLLTTSSGDFQMIRPNPKEGDALIFSPYLVHGSAVNLTDDTTRVALELRFPQT
jgi:hypothetical protein